MVFEQSFELTDSNIQKYLQNFQNCLSLSLLQHQFLDIYFRS